MKTTAKNLVDAAISAREKSYCPYSKFAVGAALLTKEGKVYTGANIESVSFTPKKGEEISAFCSPCGVCRQVMQEFCDKDFEIHLYNGEDIKTFRLIEIFPEAFNNNIL